MGASRSMEENFVHRKNLLVFLLVSELTCWYRTVRQEVFPYVIDGYEMPERKTWRGD